MKKTAFLLAVIFAISSIYITSVQAQPRKEMAKKMIMGRLMEKLNLSESQKEKLSDLRFNHQKAMIDLKAQLEKDQLALKELRKTDEIKRNDVLNAVDKINQDKNEIALAMANHVMDIYDILTPEQRKTAKKSIWNFWKEGGMHKFKGHPKMMK